MFIERVYTLKELFPWNQLFLFLNHDKPLGSQINNDWSKKNLLFVWMSSLEAKKKIPWEQDKTQYREEGLKSNIIGLQKKICKNATNVKPFIVKVNFPIELYKTRRVHFFDLKFWSLWADRLLWALGAKDQTPLLKREGVESNYGRVKEQEKRWRGGKWAG